MLLKCSKDIYQQNKWIYWKLLICYFLITLLANYAYVILLMLHI